ncbi:MAG: hypothetical protein HYY96_09895 [Candidatus Tectomicrobia bacterium]|nr:hypothetical protein [Candidatus Tectomicrobia bacterium]
MHLTAAMVKKAAREAGADDVGICKVETLETFPPNPQAPQVPSRTSTKFKSAVVLLVRMAVGEFRAKNKLCIMHVSQMALRRMDRAANRLIRFLERQGYPALQTAAQETAWDLKGGSYGLLSTRHVAVEAGLGNLGLEMNLLHPRFGPRCDVTVVLTDADLEADQRMTETLCIGESCGRCLLACPPDAVLHWNLDKRRCATYAQPLGISGLFRYFREALRAETPQKSWEYLSAPAFYDKWKSLHWQIGAFASCPRCIEVCPVGDDYLPHLADRHRTIEEKTDDKVVKLKLYRDARKHNEPIPGLDPWRLRWIGEEGYKPKKKEKATSREA